MTNPNNVFGFSFNQRPRKPRTSPGVTSNRKCSHVAPCGGDCILRGDKAHSYHSCKALECQACHGNQRFRFGGQKS